MWPSIISDPHFKYSKDILKYYFQRLCSTFYLQIVQDTADGTNESAVTSLSGLNFKGCFLFLSLSLGGEVSSGIQLRSALMLH